MVEATFLNNKYDYDFGYGYPNTGSGTMTIEYDYADATTLGSSSNQFIWKTGGSTYEYSLKTTADTNWKLKVKGNNPWVDWVSTSAETSCTTWVSNVWVRCEPRVKSVSEMVREIIRDRQGPYIIGSRKHLKPTIDPKEVRARETLKRVLGEPKFRKYMKDGFVSVQARSGKVYQIFPGHGVTRVYQDGEMVERLCVVLRGQFPPTDSLIMRYLLILNDERDFRSHAIEHDVYKRQAEPTIIANTESLNDIWNRMKSKRAAA